MRQTGTGPGPITPDGSPVEFYTLVGAGSEPDHVAEVTPHGGTVLELGCGVGRVTHPLIERGFTVVAVDESPDMLAYVRGARTVLSRIQDLHLDERFDTVMLASQLVNTPDDAERRELLDACVRHVKPGGSVLIQWMPATSQDRWQVGRSRSEGDITIKMASYEPVRPGVAAVTMEYGYVKDGTRKVWTQSFESLRLTDDELAAQLAAAGLRLDRFLTEDHTWAVARPA
ncbi:class I SAM-dependent methyltransferase [Nonomuraea fastidiosa]|jgi:SAM-dependent methyltransferase|uniref:class I SAM-dependent methyltransferase n=1 Tax=Nonomuraea TaxID=83681 RepID=UPI003255BFC9